MKKSAEARKYSIMLNTLEYSGDLPSQMMSFSSKMEKVYQCLTDLLKKKETNEHAYQKHFRIIDEKLAWYEQAGACIDSF